MKDVLKFSKVCEVKSPCRGTPGSAGIDFFIPAGFNEGNPFLLHPGKDIVIPTGIHVNVPEGYAFIAHNKSGVAIKKKLRLGADTVDSDYCGQIHIHIFNDGEYTQELSPGEKIAQFLLIPVNHCLVEETDFSNLYKEKNSERGSGWMGSTNKS